MIEEPGDGWCGVETEELRRRWGVPSLTTLRRVGSTNDVARRLAAAGAPAGAVVLADEQVAGRGRVGRRWSSPAGLGLWFSTVSRVVTAPSALPLAVGLAVAEALDSFLPSRCGLKWPNDLVFAGRKLGGILCEGSWEGAGPGAVVIGVGVNVLHGASHFPAEVASRAGSLRQLSDRPVSLLTVAASVIPSVSRLARGDVALGPGLLARISERDVLRGRAVEIREPATGAVLAAGTAAGFSSDGALLLRSGGALQAVRSGTVVVRAEPGPAD
jgi:BirA family biotin operon repressor/biotin-[acetyl-CoA-carboxylase] ligase